MLGMISVSDLIVLVAGVLSVASFFLTQRHDRRLAELRRSHEEQLSRLQSELQVLANRETERTRVRAETVLRLHELMLKTVGEITAEAEAIVRRVERASVDLSFAESQSQPDELAEIADFEDELRELRDRLFETRAKSALLPTELEDAYDALGLELREIVVGGKVATAVGERLPKALLEIARWHKAVRKWKRSILEPLLSETKAGASSLPSSATAASAP